MMKMVLGSQADLNKAMTSFARTLVPQAALTLQKKVALQMLTGVVDLNPVLTGLSRFNWQVSINSTIDTPLAGPSVQKVQMQGFDVVAREEPVIAGLSQPFQVIYLQNNIYYIVDLEDGSSKKAPAGMVQITLERVRQQFP